MESEQKEIKPAPFRNDLSLYPGPAESDGTPTYTLFDPLKGQYYKISWVQALVMQVFKRGMSVKELLGQVNRRSTLSITEKDIEQIFLSAAQLNLLAIPKTSEEVEKRASDAKQGWLLWLLMHYLYIRIPLFNPDAFLEKTLPFVRPLVSTPAMVFYLLSTLSALGIVAFNFDRYIHTFSYFFNLEGLFGYAFAIFMVKMLHEMGHAYTAKYFKIHVPTMGMAFLVLFPVLYTNVTNAWRLESRRSRFLISAAGVIVELILAGLATWGWFLTAPGLLHSMFFLVSSTTWITSLLMNCNPAMRFDGYYLLTDLMGVDNLQSRSFAVTRWKLREWLLGLNIPPPEEDMPASRVHFMMVYTIYTWIYRIILYTAIALFVYYEFTKALGIFLFIVEVVVFIMMPFISEFYQLAKRKAYFNWNTRSLITATVTAILLIWFFLPYPHKKTFQAITEPVAREDLFVPEASQIDKILVKRGDVVEPGKTLVQLKSNQLEKAIEQTAAEISKTQEEINVLTLDDQGKPYLNAKNAYLTQKQADLKKLEEKRTQLDVKAEINGVLYDFSDQLREGLYVSKGTLLGKIADPKQVRVFAFVPEADSAGVEEGAKVRFKLLNPSATYWGTISKVFRTSADTLRFPQLSSVYKGNLAVVPDRKRTTTESPKMHLLEGYYLVEIALDPTEDYLRFGKTGVVEMQGPFESKFFSLLNRAKRLIWKESGF